MSTDQEKKKRGGAREGAGRKPKREEEKINSIFDAAIKRIFAVRDQDGKIIEEAEDEEARILLIADLFTFTRGKMFIAEHVFGKPKEVSEISLKNNGPDLSNLTTEEIKAAITKLNKR